MFFWTFDSSKTPDEYKMYHSILEWFLKEHVTLKTGVILIHITEINYIFINILKQKTFILNCNFSTILLFLLYFWSNKCSFGEHLERDFFLKH